MSYVSSPHLQGTPERLIMHLVEEPSVVDPTYIEDFLLTYRTFLSNPMDVGKKLLEWFQVDTLRDTVSLVAFVVVFWQGHIPCCTDSNNEKSGKCVWNNSICIPVACLCF